MTAMTVASFAITGAFLAAFLIGTTSRRARELTMLAVALAIVQVGLGIATGDTFGVVLWLILALGTFWLAKRQRRSDRTEADR